MLVDLVGELDAVLRVRAELVVQLGRVEVRLVRQGRRLLARAHLVEVRLRHGIAAARAERMLRVVAVPDEAVAQALPVEAVAEYRQVVRPAARARRRVGVHRVVRRDHVDHHVRLVEVDGIVGIARAVGVEAAHAVVVAGMGGAIALVDGDVPEIVPGRPLALHDARVVAGLRRADHVVVVVHVAVVALGVVAVHALLRLVHAPVDAVDEEVVVAAAVVRLAHVALRVAREALLDEGERVHVAVRPRVVLRRAQVDLLELVGPLVAEERELELAHAVLAAEEEAERVLGIGRPAAVRAADADARGDAELLRRAVHRVDLLDHRRALPPLAVALRVHVDALPAVEEGGGVDDERDRLDRVREAPVEARHRVGVAVHDVAPEAVHQHLVVHPGRREARRHHALRLLEDVGEEQVGRGRVALEDRVGVRHGRAHDRRGRHGDRPRVAGRHRRGRRAVCRVEDRGGRILGARQLELERRGLVAVRHAERHLRREAAAPVAVRRARRRLREVEQLLLRHVPDDLGRKEERRVAGRIVEARHLERVLARAYERQRDVEEGRRQRVLRRPRAGGGDGDELRAVQARGEAVRVADAQPELLARGRRRVQRERPAPVGGRGRAGHSRREVRRHVRAERPRVRHPGGCRAHEAERRGAEILFALRHAEVERGAAALLEVDELHVVRAGLRQVERGRGLPVAARAPVLPRPGFLQARDLRREAVVGPDGERPQPGLRHPDRSGHHHHEVVPAHARERGIRREVGLAGFVLERNRRADVRHGIAGVPLGAVAEAELGGVHRVHGHVHRVRHHLEAAGRAGHAHGSGNRSPGPVADLVFGGGIAVQQRLGEMPVPERHVVHLLSEGVLGDDRPVGRREADSLAARGKAERRMDVARIPIRE